MAVAALAVCGGAAMGQILPATYQGSFSCGPQIRSLQEGLRQYSFAESARASSSAALGSEPADPGRLAGGMMPCSPPCARLLSTRTTPTFGPIPDEYKKLFDWRGARFLFAVRTARLAGSTGG